MKSKSSLRTVVIILGILFLSMVGHQAMARYFYPLSFEAEIQKNAETFHLDVYLVMAVIHTESHFKEKAVSPVGAVGLMQLLPSTAAYMAETQGVVSPTEVQLKESSINIYLGCAYLRYLLDKFENVNTGLAAYNAGEGRVALWLADNRYSEDGRTLKKIPYGETERYVRRVENAALIYRKLY